MKTIAAPAVTGRPSFEEASPTEALQTALVVTAATLVLLVLAGSAAAIGAWAWLLSGATALVAGFLMKKEQRWYLVLALVPATLLTNSAIVPSQGRYVPAVTLIGALLVASRTDVGNLATRVGAIPTWLRRVLIVYLAWMALTTVTSTEHEVSVAYMVGNLVTIGVAFLAIPSLPRRHRLVQDLTATLVITGVCMVVSGVLLALVGSIHLYGKSVGLFFFEEAVLFGHPTGIVFLQDYGPFVGPETTPLALGVVGSIYLRSISAGRWRLAWGLAGLTILLGFITTFSREGWMITVVGCLSIAILAWTSRVAREALAVGLVMLVIFIAGITNVFGVIGRMDLVTSWYGPGAASVLLNPNVTQRGQQPQPSTPTPSPTSSSRSVQSPCASSGGSTPPPVTTNPTVELKGFSSLLARICLWKAALYAIRDRPVVGFGPGTDADAIIPYLAGEAGLAGATTHNTFLRVGVEMGVPGLAIYLALTAIAAWLSVSWLRRPHEGAEVVIAASILGITVAEVSGTLLFAGLSFPGFWLALCVGLLAVPAGRRGTGSLNGRNDDLQGLAPQFDKVPQPQP